MPSQGSYPRVIWNRAPSFVRRYLSNLATIGLTMYVFDVLFSPFPSLSLRLLEPLSRVAWFTLVFSTLQAAAVKIHSAGADKRDRTDGDPIPSQPVGRD